MYLSDRARMACERMSTTESTIAAVTALEELTIAANSLAPVGVGEDRLK